MNSLLSPSFSPTSLVSDSCRLDKGLIIPWICQALTSPMSPCDWCTVSGALPAENPNFFTVVGANMYVCLLMVPYQLTRSPYGVLGGLNRPSFGILAWVVVVVWLGSVEHWLAREKARVCWAGPSNRLSSLCVCAIQLFFPVCEKTKGTIEGFQEINNHLQNIK